MLIPALRFLPEGPRSIEVDVTNVHSKQILGEVMTALQAAPAAAAH